MEHEGLPYLILPGGRTGGPGEHEGLLVAALDMVAEEEPTPPSTHPYYYREFVMRSAA